MNNTKLVGLDRRENRASSFFVAISARGAASMANPDGEVATMIAKAMAANAIS